MIVGALHFVTGKNYQGPFPVFVNGYLIDILLPMTLFLLMGLIENRLVGSTLFRALAVFGFGCLVEASQYFRRPFFGSTFDPLDILAYAGGVALGILFELTIQYSLTNSSTPSHCKRSIGKRHMKSYLHCQ